MKSTEKQIDQLARAWVGRIAECAGWQAALKVCSGANIYTLYKTPEWFIAACHSSLPKKLKG